MDAYKRAVAWMDPDDFAGGVLEKAVQAAEYVLHITFPPEYRAFLLDFGSGNAGDLETLFGLGADGYYDVIGQTCEARKNGLPHHLIPVYDLDVGGSLHCLDTKTGAVVQINREGQAEPAADSFGAFLYQLFSEDRDT